MDASLRQLVWQRAADRCEYCQVPQSLDPITFHIDHIIAQKHQGATSVENTALSCFACNNHKSSDIAGIDREGPEDQVVRLFHPRKDNWHEHFEWDGPVLQAKTAIGRVTLCVLGINLPHRLAFRQRLISEGAFPPPAHA